MHVRACMHVRVCVCVCVCVCVGGGGGGGCTRDNFDGLYQLFKYYFLRGLDPCVGNNDTHSASFQCKRPFSNTCVPITFISLLLSRYSLTYVFCQ